MSLIELIGAIVGTIYLLLEYRASRWLWLFGALMPLFYLVIFFGQKLYANATLNLYYLCLSVYGILQWRKAGSAQEASDVTIPTSVPPRMWLWIALAATCLSVLITVVLYLLGESENAALDGITSSLSVVGMWMMAKRYYQQWFCWAIVNPLMVVLSIKMKLYPTAIMYTVYCVIVILGYIRWKRLYLSNQ